MHVTIRLRRRRPMMLMSNSRSPTTTGGGIQAVPSSCVNSKRERDNERETIRERDRVRAAHSLTISEIPHHLPGGMVNVNGRLLFLRYRVVIVVEGWLRSK